MKTQVNPKELVKACGTLAVLAVSAVLGVAGCAGDLEGEDFPNAITAGGPSGGSGGAPAGGSGGTPTAGTSGGMAPPLDACVTTVFTATCTGVCHNTMNAGFFGNLDLSTADVGTRLADKPSIGMMAPCPTSPKLINTANPADSVLLHRIKGTGCGTQMPSPQMPLSPQDQACIETWLNKF